MLIHQASLTPLQQQNLLQQQQQFDAHLCIDAFHVESFGPHRLAGMLHILFQGQPPEDLYQELLTDSSKAVP